MIQTYRIPYNQHKYQDLSDNPRRAYIHIRASNHQEAEADLYDWRRLHADGITTKQGNRYYIGSVFPEAAEITR